MNNKIDDHWTTYDVIPASFAYNGQKHEVSLTIEIKYKINDFSFLSTSNISSDQFISSHPFLLKYTIFFYISDKMKIKCVIC